MPSSVKLYLVALTTILISITAVADENKAYVQLNVGAVFAEPYKNGGQFCNNLFGCSVFSYKEDSDPGYVAGAAIGYRLADWFRLEGEAMYQSNDLTKSVLTSNTQNFGSFTQSGNLHGERERTTFLVNGYYDFKNSTAFTPYVSGGLGGYHLRINARQGRQSGENDLAFAWQLGAGVNYKLDDRVSFDLKYRYLDGDNAQVVVSNGQLLPNSNQRYGVGDHQIVVGLRIGF